MAQLARACVLHTQGYRFDPDYLQLHSYFLFISSFILLLILF